MLSTLGVALLSGRYTNRAAWIGSHLVMALGVAAPLFWPGIGGIALSALCVGGTFMVATMAGMQEARRVAPDNAASLMASMTAAFAIGQILGPILVSILAGDPRGMDLTLIAASVALTLGAMVLIRPEK